ncbi:MAG: enoyl-CoA hydratase [Deltaproteobacteria bacterium SG8_13]|nr:MAG: enoyl-CoA hydratase [Deltaproteobacteria bacterium SG8_13]
MENFECIAYEKKAGIATITLHRPQVLNAINRQMWLDIEAALADAAKDAAVKVLIFTGEGRAFSTGADQKESKSRSLEDYRSYLEQLQEITRRIIRFEKPTIAAINGYALGSGFELALACDIRIASEQAQIGSPEAKATSCTTGGALQLIQDLVGPAKARELLFSGDSVSGREAERIGLINRAVAQEELMDAVLKMAVKIAANAAFSVKMIKRGLLMARNEASLETLMNYEVEARLACDSTQQKQQSVENLVLRKKK